jgi:hypothetical protein
MRFLADMGISPKIVKCLQSLGHQAVHLQQEGLRRLKDSEMRIEYHPEIENESRETICRTRKWGESSASWPGLGTVCRFALILEKGEDYA